MGETAVTITRKVLQEWQSEQSRLQSTIEKQLQQVDYLKRKIEAAQLLLLDQEMRPKSAGGV